MHTHNQNTYSPCPLTASETKNKIMHSYPRLQMHRSTVSCQHTLSGACTHTHTHTHTRARTPVRASAAAAGISRAATRVGAHSRRRRWRTRADRAAASGRAQRRRRWCRRRPEGWSVGRGRGFTMDNEKYARKYMYTCRKMQSIAHTKAMIANKSPMHIFTNTHRHMLIRNAGKLHYTNGH